MGATSLQAAGKSAAENCFDCHSDKDLTKSGPNGTTESLFVDGDRFAKAVHASLKCKDCHADLKENHADTG
jgi:hypothetical protein